MVEPGWFVRESPNSIVMVAPFALLITPGDELSELPFTITVLLIVLVLARLESDKFVIVPSSMVPELSSAPSAVSKFVMEPSSEAIF